MRNQTLRRNRTRKPAAALSALNKELLALATGVSTALAVTYLWVYLHYIGRIDLLIPSLGNARALLVLFAVSVLCFPCMFLLIALPAILLVKSGDWLRVLAPNARTTTSWIACAALATVLCEAGIYFLRIEPRDSKAAWASDWVELVIALPVLVGLSLHRNRTDKPSGTDTRSHPFWQGMAKAGLAGVFVWLIALAVCLPVSQALEGEASIVVKFLRIAFLASCLLGAGIMFMRWRERMADRADLWKRSFFLSAFLLAAVFVFCPEVLATTMKNVAYAMGMRARHPGLFLIGEPHKASDFGAIWDACAIDEKRVRIQGRKMFAFGDVVLVCPANYTSPSTRAMRECALEECFTVQAADVRPWIGPNPAQCPPVRTWEVKSAGCRNWINMDAPGGRKARDQPSSRR